MPDRADGIDRIAGMAGLSRKDVEDYLGPQTMSTLSAFQALVRGGISREEFIESLDLPKPEGETRLCQECFRHVPVREVHELFVDRGDGVLRDTTVCEDCIRAAGYEPPSREGEAQDA